MRLRTVLPVILFVAGCTPRPTVPPPTVTLAVQIVPIIRPTLPPTWTPAPSPTPEPTNTSIPTETPIPTLSAEAICQGFGLVAAPGSGTEFAYDGTVTFAWAGMPRGTRLSLTLTYHEGKQGIRLDVDVPDDNVVPISLTRLPDETSGRYDWRVWLTHPIYGELCVKTGYIVRKALVIM